MRKQFILTCCITLFTVTFFGPINLYAQPDRQFRSVEEVKGLRVGDTVPDFSAIGFNIAEFQLARALNQGPVVVVFYRGRWCPVCNRHISALQDSIALINKKGALLIAVSPEKPEYGAKTAEKTGATYALLYDKDYEIATKFDVLFQPDAATSNIYNAKLYADLKSVQSDDSQRLPVPATFIIGQDGVILWRHFNPDYRERATVTEILKNLP